MGSLLERMPKKAMPLNSDRTLNVMAYELGAVAKSHVYASHALNRFPPNEGEALGYKVSARADMADLITQCRVFCEQQGWDFQTLMKDGEVRFLERMEELGKDIV